MVTNKLGPPVFGEDFFDREKEITEIWNLLKDGNNPLILAPRRVGKTSLMTRLQEQARHHGFFPVFLSVSDVASEEMFIQRLRAEFRRQMELSSTLKDWLSESWFGQLLMRVKKAGPVELAEPAGGRWHTAGEALGDLLDRFNAPGLLLIDELPLCVLNLLKEEQKPPSHPRVKPFLSWLRELRIGPKANRNLRWLFAGSIGLDTVTSRANLGDTINDLTTYADFGPFQPEVASRFLDELANTYHLPLPDDVKNRLCERAGWLIPYHLQLLFSELRADCDDRKQPATPSAVDAAFESLLKKRNYFDFWVQRLEIELGAADNRRALALASAAARDPNGATANTLRQTLAGLVPDPEERERECNYLLRVLKCDGYLVSEGDRYRFRSELLRQFWLRSVINE